VSWIAIGFNNNWGPEHDRQDSQQHPSHDLCSMLNHPCGPGIPAHIECKAKNDGDQQYDQCGQLLLRSPGMPLNLVASVITRSDPVRTSPCLGYLSSSEFRKFLARFPYNTESFSEPR
jgi:hypothetical protein